MLEHETDQIRAALMARTIGDRETILLRDILAADIPRGIKTYIQAETVRLFESELFSLPRFSRVDRRAAGFRSHGRAFIAAMSALYSFPREEYLSLLENTIHFLENYLCRPQWTIENFVFESGGRVPAHDVVAKLECTVDYSYFRTLIQKILQRRGIKEIGAEDFRAMLVRIDDQIVKQHNARELALLAKPIFDFLLLRDTPPDVSIPLKPILVFFEDKKMNILRDYIESICRIRERSEITLDELTTLVEDLYLGQAAPPAPDPPSASAASPVYPQDPAPSFPPAPEPPQESRPSESPVPGTPAEEPEEQDYASPLPADESDGYLPTIEIQLPSIFDFVTEEPDGRDDGPPEPEGPKVPGSYQGQFASTSPWPGLADLRELIQGHTRSRFVKRLFDRNDDQYEDVITSLNNCPAWKDATLLLNSLYVSHGLDPFDPDVVEFTDAIHRRYLGAEKEGL